MEVLLESDMSTNFKFSIYWCGSEECKKKFFRLKKYRRIADNGGTPVLYLNAGDTYTGTPWFSLYKDKIVTSFLNLLKPDAIVTI